MFSPDDPVHLCTKIQSALFFNYIRTKYFRKYFESQTTNTRTNSAKEENAVLRILLVYTAAESDLSTALESGNWISAAHTRLSNSNLRFLAEHSPSYIRQNGRIRSNGIYSTLLHGERDWCRALWEAEEKENGRGDETRTKDHDHRHQAKARNYGD